VAERPISDHWFEEFLKEEKIMGSRCTACKTLFVPPRSVCSKCYSAEMQWEEIASKGRLAAFTCIAIGPSFMTEEGYDRKNPYCTGVVELTEQTRVVARIEGVDTQDPASIKVGMPLSAKFLHRDSGDKPKTFLAFEPQITENE
jgi:uncharacterized OB-fold protein